MVGFYFILRFGVLGGESEFRERVEGSALEDVGDLGVLVRAVFEVR